MWEHNIRWENDSEPGCILKYTPHFPSLWPGEALLVYQ